jgi:DNA excision repair protein ERCC-2
MKKKFILSVTDFSQPAPKTGSIDLYSGFSEGQSTGIQLHKEIQAIRERQFPSYHSEVLIKHEFHYKKYLFEVRGRIDGLFLDEKIKIEEIKSGFNINKLFNAVKQAQDTHPYCLQLKTYGYIHWLQTKEIPALNLHLVSSRNKRSLDLEIIINIDKIEAWLERRLLDLANQVMQAEKRIKHRKKLAKQFVFPFPNPRRGQKELIETVEAGMQENRPMLIQAPTGLGKTTGILYPVLKESMLRGQKTIYLTPKNSQHAVAQDAVKKIQEKGQSICSMTITAKNKICFKSQPICNSEYCEYAKDYYTKVTENNLLAKLKEEKNLTDTVFKKIGLQYEVCPFELQMDSIEFMDTIICDYNYVFSPNASNNRIGNIFLGENEKPNLVIDEFHNLPSRAMNYYSPALSIDTIKNIILSIDKVDSRFREKLHLLLADSSLIIENCGNKQILIPHKITPPIQLFKDHELIIREFLADYLESTVEIGSQDIALDFCNYWMEFTSSLEFINSEGNEFFTSFYPQEMTVKITCCDASSMLISCYSYYQQVLGFSATLKPFNFYSQLSGLSNKNLITAEFDTPFSKSQRKLIIIPQLSSRYIHRSYNYPRIADAIKKISSLKQGNYLVFFPSFDFLEQVLKIYSCSEGVKLICQKRKMAQVDIKNILKELQAAKNAHLVFCVQGGGLSEGVDYPGDMIIGAFVVGTPLPVFDWEREQMRVYYEEKYKKGLDYAYIYPAMAKSIQASGRVIRSEQDNGIIILMDDRFLQESYAKCMPQDWYESKPHEMISTNILKDIELFWLEN